MRLIASIPVRKVLLSPVSYTFEHEWVECQVVTLIRSRVDRFRERYCYAAIIIKPAVVHLEAVNLAADADRHFRVAVCRRRNPGWKPPLFPDGENVLHLVKDHGAP